MKNHQILSIAFSQNDSDLDKLYMDRQPRTKRFKQNKEQEMQQAKRDRKMAK
jgi:hypothetical protein